MCASGCLPLLEPGPVPLLIGLKTELCSAAVQGQGVITDPVAGLKPFYLMSSAGIGARPGHITKHQDYTSIKIASPYLRVP